MISLRQTRFRFSRFCGKVVLAFGPLLLSQPSEAQLFGEKGLLNRKTEAPRDLTEEEIGLPTPVTGKVEVLKGTEATFEIRAETKTPAASVEFLIRTFPSAGKIVSLTSNPGARNRAIVTYYAEPGTSADKDAFAFAVRYRGGRYSSAMRFDIDLVDTQAEIQVEKEVDFGSAMVGDSVKKELTVRNLGNGLFERQLYLSPPWFLTEPKDGKLVLPPRESRNITVSFRPQMIGETSYFLSLSRSKSGTTKFFGSGLDPFTVVSEEIELTLDPDTYTREGEIVLMNGGTRPILVQANGSTRLQQALEKEYILAPEKETRIPVSLGRTDTAPFDGMVQFSLKNGYMKTARVVSAVVPGRLEIDIPDSISSDIINFGKVAAGKTLERGFTITNTGGVAVPLEFHLPEPFRMLNDPGTQLAPLSSVNIAVGLFPAIAHRGMVDVTMNVYGDEQTLPVRLLGNVVKPENGVAGAPQKSAADMPLEGLRLSSGMKGAVPVENTNLSSSLSVRPGNFTEGSDSDLPPPGNGKGLWFDDLDPEEVEEMRSPLGFITRPLVPRKTDPELGSPEDLSVVERDSESLTIGWTAPKGAEYASFEVELAGIQALPGSLPASVWVPYENVEYERIGRLVKAKIDGLAPASTYEFRVLTVSEENTSSQPSEALVAQTELPMDWTYIYLGLGILTVIALGFGVRRIYLDRRPEVYQAKYADS